MSDQTPVDEDANGVFVITRQTPEGGIEVDVKTVGDTRVTEVDTLLAMARKTFRARTGLD